MRRRLIPTAALLGMMASSLVFATPPGKYSPPQVDRKVQQEIRNKANKSLCPKGLPWLQGTWRFVGPTRVIGFSDVLTFTGSRYVEKIAGGPPHRYESGELLGQYACVDENRLLLRIGKATPEGVFGNRSGDDYPCDWRRQPSKEGPERVVFICYVEWDLRSVKGLDLEFERVPVDSSKKR